MTSEREILKKFDVQMRRRRAERVVEKIERAGDVTRARLDFPDSPFGVVVYSRLGVDTVEDAIEEQIRVFSSEGRAFEWKVYGHDTPPDLGERLSRRGFRPSDKEALMCLELEHVPFAPVPEGIRIVPLVDEWDALVALDREAGREPGDYYELMRERAESPEALTIYLAWDGRRPVARSWIRFHREREFADLWGGETSRSHRGRGIYRAMVALRAAEAKARGAQFLTIDALPSSRPIVEKMGFRFLTATTPYIWVPLS